MNRLEAAQVAIPFEVGQVSTDLAAAETEEWKMVGSQSLLK